MKSFSTMLNEAKLGDTYWIESAKLDFAMELTRHMKAKSINKSDMAKRMGTSPAYITKLLRGDANLTIQSMVKAARLLGCNLQVKISNNSADIKHADTVNKCSKQPLSAHTGLHWIADIESTSKHKMCIGKGNIATFGARTLAPENKTLLAVTRSNNMFVGLEKDFQLTNETRTHGDC